MEIEDKETAARSGECKGADDEDDIAGGVDAIDPDRQCGLGSFHPPWLQGCANMKSFTAVLSCVTVFGSMNFRFVALILIGCLDDIFKTIFNSHLLRGFINLKIQISKKKINVGRLVKGPLGL